jgi:hypothetical protein
MGGSITYRTLSSKRVSFQIGIDWWSHSRKVPKRGWISHTYPVWLWGCSPRQISSPGPVFYGTKWLLWRPHIQSPTLHSRCGISKVLIKRESTIDHCRSRCNGWYGRPLIHTYTHTYSYIREIHGSKKPSQLLQFLSWIKISVKYTHFVNVLF